jgi:carbonic anhydrase
MTGVPSPDKSNDNSTLFSNLKSDIPAGIAVFLVSIPLSLGIAMASGAPLFAGLITGIVGGLVVAPISNSALGISGAAAGLAVMVAPAITKLGFNGYLLAVIFAGLVQILMGVSRSGIIAYYFPSSVVNGMLTGIGLIIFLKQIPHAIGYDLDYEGDFTYEQPDRYSSFTELFHMLDESQAGALLIVTVSLGIILLWESPFMKKRPIFQLLPAPLMAVAAGIIINELLKNAYPDIALSKAHLVMIPVIQDVSGLLQQLHFPDFNQLSNPDIYYAGLTLAVVASLETLLTLDAVDKLDAYKRITGSNRELIAQGIGNISCGLIGGLPLTQVVVRSSINAQSGAKTHLAAILNGLLLLLAVATIPAVLNKIPLASLAAILIVVGIKLVKPDTIKAVYQSGWYHFIPFCATVLGLVFTNILFGILIGLTTALFSILLENYKSAVYFKESHIGNKIIFRLSEHVSFLNRANIQTTLESLPPHSEVVIDATRTKYIDYDVYEIIQNFKSDAHHKHIKLILENMRGYGPLPPIQNARAQTYESQQLLTPDKVLAILKEGNERFVYNLKSNRNLLEQVNDTRDGQFPIAIILSCMDSRTSVELIFDLGLGDAFSARIAGNIVNDDILGSMEFASKLAGSKLVVVLGHTRCGAVKGACADAKLDHLTGLLAKIKPAIDCVQSEIGGNKTLDTEELVQKVADKNVQLAVENIRQQSAVLAGMESNGEIAIVGGMYDIETGKVKFF